MRFTVPQFIEREAKIVGPLTFKQFIYLAIAGAICFVLYFTLAKENFTLFILITAILIGIASALAFYSIGGRSVPTVVANFFKFSLATKIFIWRKKAAPIEISKKEVKKVEKDDELPLKIAENSQLKKLRTRIETKTK